MSAPCHATMLPCYHWLVTSTTRIPESQTPRPPQCAAVLPCIQSSTAQVRVHSRIATISASLPPSLSDAFPAQDKKDSPSHQDFEPHSCNIHVKHLQDGPAVDQLFRSLHSKHAIWQQTCFPERTRHNRTKVLGSPAANVTRSSDTNPVREKGSTPTHTPGRLGNHAASELLGRSQWLHWNTSVRPLHARDAGPMTSFTNHLGTFEVQQETHFKLRQTI